MIKEIRNLFQYYFKIVKKNIQDYSNPLLRKVKGKNTAINIWRFGEKNPDKIIYFITDLSTEGSGIFSMYLGILNHLSIAKGMGWIPVIDDTSGLFRRNKHKFRKRENVLNELFEFDNEISTEEVLQSRNVIISSITDCRIFNGEKIKKKDKSIFEYADDELCYWRKFERDNLSYKKNVQIELENVYSKLIDQEKIILGVAVREGKMGMTDKGLRKSGEEKQPLIEEIIEKTRFYLNKWKCDKIYLSCETDRTVELFQENFGKDEVIFLSRIRMDFDYVINIKSMKDGIKKDSKNLLLQKNYKKYDFDYVKDMYILSKCDFCIMPINCGTEVAFLKNDRLKNYFIMRG